MYTGRKKVCAEKKALRLPSSSASSLAAGLVRLDLCVAACNRSGDRCQFLSFSIAGTASVDDDQPRRATCFDGTPRIHNT